jgi:hypothetical protein
MERPKRGVILDVPYMEKEKAKELGAWWDPELKKWFVPAGKDTKPFEKWLVVGDQGSEQAVN